MGKVSLETWTIESSALGSMKVERQSMSWLGCRSGETLVTVMADGKWVQTKVSVGKDASVSVKAEGQVDIRPQQGPSTYLVSPKGYNAVGTGSSFMGGALIGKVGAGDPFVIGESTEFTTRHSGPLFLMIVPSPWNCHSSGSYNVKIRQERR
jgi:hypothetical protein